MAISEAVAGIISAGIGAAGAAGSAAIGSTANRRAYKWSKKYYDWQNQYNLQNYSPQKQMERLTAAGLNPHLVTGDSINPSGQMATPTGEMPGIDLTSVAQQILNYSIAKQQSDNQTNATNADVDLKQSQKIAQDYQNEFLLPQQFQKTAKSITQMDQEIQLFDTRKKLLESQYEYQQLANKIKKDESQFSWKKYKYTADKIEADAGFRQLEYDDYLNYNVRPNDPFWWRQAAPVADIILQKILNFLDRRTDDKNGRGGPRKWLKEIFGLK